MLVYMHKDHFSITYNSGKVERTSCASKRDELSPGSFISWKLAAFKRKRYTEVLEEKDSQREKHVVNYISGLVFFCKIVLDMLIEVQKIFDGWIIRDLKPPMRSTSTLVRILTFVCFNIKQLGIRRGGK